MHTPRCGVKDILTKGNQAKRRRRKRYALQGSKISARKLYWRVTQYPSTNKFRQVENQTLGAYVNQTFSFTVDVKSETLWQKLFSYGAITQLWLSLNRKIAREKSTLISSLQGKLIKVRILCVHKMYVSTISEIPVQSTMTHTHLTEKVEL